jgi:predicted oxidoreductase
VKTKFKKEIIYGCMGLGGDWDTNHLTANDILIAEKAIEAALDSGITIFDHADIYKLGKAESIFGNILYKNSSLRDKIVLQSKAGIRFRELGDSSIYDLSKKYLLQQVDLILQRLQTDYLDIFLLHRPDPLLNPEEIGEAFSILKESGKVKSFGVSNMSLHQIEIIQKYCDEPLVANQIQLSLGHSLVIDAGVLVNTNNHSNFNGVEGLLEYAQTHDLAIQAYSPLDGGRFIGNFELASNNDKKTIRLVSQLAEKYNTTVETIVLAWLFKVPGTIQPVIGTTNTERIRACKDAVNIVLSRVDWYNLWVMARGESIP